MADAEVRDNEFRNISGPYIVSFSGAVNSLFIGNSIFDSTTFDIEGRTSPEALIQFRNGYCDKLWCLEDNTGETIKYGSRQNTVLNNVFRNNNTKYIYREIQYYGIDNDVDNVIDRNAYSSSAVSFFDGREFTRADMAHSKGYDKRLPSARTSPVRRISDLTVEVPTSADK